MAEFDDLAEHYDLSRGGERRGDEYASDIHDELPADEDPILEIGVGTGVVALGLTRRGRRVVGLDVSIPMLTRARVRLRGSVVASDAMEMAVATASVAHAVSVWVLQAVPERDRLMREVGRVLRPGGRYVVCLGQRPAPDDPIGRIIEEMGARIDRLHPSRPPRGVGADEVLGLGERLGFAGRVRVLTREWVSTPSDELAAITHRVWPALRALDETDIEVVTRPAVEALHALPPTGHLRRATADMVVLTRG